MSTTSNHKFLRFVAVVIGVVAVLTALPGIFTFGATLLASADLATAASDAPEINALAGGIGATVALVGLIATCGWLVLGLGVAAGLSAVADIADETRRMRVHAEAASYAA